MPESKKQLLSACSVFVIIELFFSVAIHFVGGRANDIISFASIVCVCLFALLFFERDKDYYLVQLGLFCTVMADLFLLIAEPREQLLAMLFFSVTQICYFIRLYSRDKKHRTAHLTVRISVTLIALIITCLVLGERTDLLSLVSLFYFANLGINMLWAFIEYRISRLFGPGLLLFILCDICIGLSVMSADYIPVSAGSFIYFLVHPGFNLAWVFYIPAQVLIALSLAEARMQKEKALK